jgi:hypothetical protein
MIDDINCELLNIALDLTISDRIETMAKREEYLVLLRVLRRFSIFPTSTTDNLESCHPNSLHLYITLEGFSFQLARTEQGLPRDQTQLTVDKMPLLVSGRSANSIRNLRVSDSTHHWTPRALPIGRASQVGSRSWMPFVCSSGGIASMTSLLFEIILWRWKLPF